MNEDKNPQLKNPTKLSRLKPFANEKTTSTAMMNNTSTNLGSNYQASTLLFSQQSNQIRNGIKNMSLIFDERNAPVNLKSDKAIAKQISKEFILIKPIEKQRQLSPTTSKNENGILTTKSTLYSSTERNGTLSSKNERYPDILETLTTDRGESSEYMSSKRSFFPNSSTHKHSKSKQLVLGVQEMPDLKQKERRGDFINQKYSDSLHSNEDSVRVNTMNFGAFDDSKRIGGNLTTGRLKTEYRFGSQSYKKTESQRNSQSYIRDPSEGNGHQDRIMRESFSLKNIKNGTGGDSSFFENKASVQNRIVDQKEKSLLNSSTVKKQVINRGDVSHIDSHSATQMDYPKCHDKIYDSMLLSPNEIQNIHKKRTNQDKFWVKSKTKKFKRELQIKSDQFSFVKK